MSSVVSHAVQFATDFLLSEWAIHPYHLCIELFFGIVIVYFVLLPYHKPRHLRREEEGLTAAEEKMLLDEFTTVPFNTAVKPDFDVKSRNAKIERFDGAYAYIAKKKCLNAASLDMLSYATDSKVKAVAVATIKEYGVGSCGPRGFYGSIKPHLDLEADLTKFMKTEGAIIYSLSFATASSIIPCFASKGDFVFCDELVNLVVQNGCNLSRSRVTYFKHNDMNQLESLMAGVDDDEKKNRRKLVRKFVVTEGLFRNSGDVCPLPRIVELCKKYRFRVILDDCIGFGTLGATGRGTPEYCGVPQSDVDIYIGSMATALGSSGGFCVAGNIAVEHQRLASVGYVFSASLPPFIAAAASKALHLLETDPHRAKRVVAMAKLFRSQVSDMLKNSPSIAMVNTAADSPLIHLRYADTAVGSKTRLGVEEMMQSCVKSLQENHSILVARAAYNHEERSPPKPSLRIAIRYGMEEADIARLAQVVISVMKEELAK